MDRFRRFDKFGYGILDDPSLKTTANDFKFKYIPKEQFQRVIKMVANDRTKDKKTWADPPQQAMTSKEYSNSSVRGKKLHKNTNKHMIKTEKSTIKILTHPMLDKSPQVSRPRPQKKKKDYIVPKIRIMTDDEIQKVVENAVKEIMEKDDTRHEVTARSIRHNYEITNNEAKPLYSPNLDLHSIFNEPNRNDYSKSVSVFSDVFNETNTYNDYEQEESQKELIQSVLGEDLQTENLLRSFSKSSLNINEELRVSDKGTTPRWVDNFNNTDENLSILIENFNNELLSEDVDDEDSMHTGNLQKSYRSVSVHSFSSSSPQSISLQNKEDIEEDQKLNHTLEKIGQSSKATLTSFDKKELETLLGVKAIVNRTGIDFVSCESKSSGDEFEEENEKEIKTNIFPVIHIRQPKHGKSTESETERDDKDNNNTPRTPTEFDEISLTNSDFAYSREEAGHENIEEPFYPKESPRPATPIAPPVKKIPPSSRQLESSEGSAYKNNTPKNSTMPKVLKARRPLKSPMTPQDLSPYKIKDMNEDKLLIFSKITSYQEKIIGLLDQLRINLLNLSLPDGQPDRTRRENHVIEFTARFSRNYLYQLERMIKDLQLISKEQYLSRHSNEHRTKICVIYGILYQATQSYLKQIKYFLLDQSPRKLDVLIRFIVNATNICINKNVFDKKDKVVSCLLDRCNNMLGFLADLKDQRKRAAMSDRSIKTTKPKVPSKFEALVKNKLSMYEPSVLTTVRKRKVVKKKKTKKMKEKVKNETEQPNNPVPEVKPTSSHEDNITNLEPKKSNLDLNMNDSHSNLFLNRFPDFEKEIMTQMEKITKENANTISPPNMMSSEDLSIDCFDSGITKLEDDESEMKARVYEALQTITKQQVHQMLGPLVCNLGCILNKSMSAMDLETLLNDLNVVNSQVVKATPTGSGTFNRKDDTEEAHDCEDSKSLGGEHATGSEHRLDLTQSKQCARALLNRRFGLPSSGEDYDVVVGTSHQRVELLVPNVSPRELPTIEEERRNHLKDEGGAGNPPASTHPSDKKVQQLRYDKNIQFTFVSSEDDFVEPKEKTPGIVNMEFNLPLEELCDQVFYEEKIYSKPEADSDEPEALKEECLEGILEDRLNFIRQIADNPLYVNEFFSQPWKIITRLTKKIVDQAIYDVEKEISFGEESYLEDFLKMETDLQK